MGMVVVFCTALAAGDHSVNCTYIVPASIRYLLTRFRFRFGTEANRCAARCALLLWPRACRKRAAGRWHVSARCASAGFDKFDHDKCCAVRRQATRSMCEQLAKHWLERRARFLGHSGTTWACCCFGTTLVDRVVCHEGLAGPTLWMLFAHGHGVCQLVGCILQLQWLRCAVLSTLCV